MPTERVFSTDVERSSTHSDGSYIDDYENDASNGSDSIADCVEDAHAKGEVSEFSPESVACESLVLPRNQAELSIAAAIVRMPRYDFGVQLAYSVADLACYATMDLEEGDDENPYIDKTFGVTAISVSFRCCKNYS